MSFITDNLLSIFIACLVILVYLLIKKRLTYFSSRGLPFIKPSRMEILKSLSLTNWEDIQMEAYNRGRGKGYPCIGFFHTFLTPSLLVTDPVMAERILIKDFSHFHDHGFDIDPGNEPLAKHLFNLKGDHWRTLRHKLLPTFTSGKLKSMVPLMEHCAQVTIKDMKEDVSLREEVNLKELCRRYTLAVIATCVFGIDLESIKDPHCEFRQILKKALAPTFFMQIKLLVAVSFPKIAEMVGFKFFNKDTEDFFLKLTKDSLEMRKSSGIKRNDFVQLLLELKEKGSVEMDVRDLEEDEKIKVQFASVTELPNHKLEITEELLSAQTFGFLAGGFDNTAYLVSLTTYMLGKHKNVQQKIREEVKEAKIKHGGMNYLALKDMKLLEASIDESLRMHPSVFVLDRICNKTYSLGNGVNIEKGMSLIIPNKIFQNDNQYWSEPEKFNPERFLNKAIQPGIYSPFGDGPRICIEN